MGNMIFIIMHHAHYSKWMRLGHSAPGHILMSFHLTRRNLSIPRNETVCMSVIISQGVDLLCFNSWLGFYLCVRCVYRVMGAYWASNDIFCVEFLWLLGSFRSLALNAFSWWLHHVYLLKETFTFQTAVWLLWENSKHSLSWPNAAI